MPGAWNQASAPGKPPGAFGHATYRLRVDCRAQERLALVLPLQHSAVRLYVNGRLAAAQGTPGASPELARPAFEQHIAPLEAACPLEIVAHVSNHEMRQGGLLRSVELGSEREVLLRRERNLVRDMFVLGGVTVLSLLPILFWLGRREDRAPLWAGIYGLSSASFIAIGGERIAQPWIAPLGWEAAWKIVLVAMLAGLAAFPSFVRALYADHFPRALHRSLVAASALFALLVFATPARIYTQAVPALYVLTAAVALCCVVVLLRAALARRQGAWLILAGTAALFCAATHDMVTFSNLLASKLTPWGLLAFSVAPAVLVARRFARALRGEELRAIEQRQQAELADRARFSQDLIDSVPVALAMRDEAGRYMLVNRRWEEYFGARREDVVGRTVLERAGPRMAPALLALDRAVLERGPGALLVEDDFEYRGRKYTQTRSVMTGPRGEVIGVLIASIDTNERAAMEERLREQVALTDAIVAQAPNAIFVKDREGRFTLVNRGWEENFGIPAAKTLGRTVHDLFPPEDAQRFAAEDENLIAQGASAPPLESLNTGPGPDQFRIVRKAVLSRGDTVLGIVCSSIDVSEIKRMERDLESEQRRLDLVVRAQQVGIVDWDGRTHQTFYSPRFRQILGHAPDADTSGWPDYFRVLIHPEDRERVTTRWRAFVTGKSDEGRGNYYAPEEYRLLRADGSYVWVEVAGLAVRDERGFVARWIAAVTDVTEQRDQREALARQRERLALLVRSTKAGFLDWDAVADTRVYSERFKEMLGHPPDADTSAWPSLFDMMHPDDREPQREAFREMLRKGAATGERLHGPLEYRLRKADGSYLWVRGEGVAQIGADGRTERFLTSYIDITHLREMNLALEESVRLREEVDRISRHDLKTPLNSIVGIPRLLRDSGRLAPEDAELLAFVEQAGYRLLNMVNLSLDMLQMERGSYPFSPRAVDLRDVLEKVLRDLQTHARAKRLAMRIDGPRLHVLAEELLCYSLFANLVKNAVEASPDDGAVTVTLAQAGDAVEVRVHNAGAVPEAVRAGFFDKYSTAGKQGGSGLGTYSARLMARTQNGDIAMQSSAADGTTLRVTLKRAEAPATPPQPVAAAPESPAPGAKQPASLLVVDDDDYTRVFVQRFLPALRSAAAANGREALEAVRADPPEVIVMDLDMPVMGGLEAARQIRQWEKETKHARCTMIAMSSDDHPEVPARCAQAGFDHFVPKPVSPDALRRAVAGQTRGQSQAARPVPEADPAAPVRVAAKLKDALPGFLASRRALLDELERAIAAGRAEPVRALAHKIAGSFALYGFHWAAGQGKMIERRAGAGALGELAAEAAALRRHLETVKVEIAE